MNPTKYKSVPPQETVRRIKSILQEKGIETQEEWTDSGVGSICSVRVTIKGTQTGQNGKGTDRDFALASGYAEFMERLQTGYLLPEGLSTMADRQWWPLEKVKEAGGPLLEGTLRRIRHVDGGFDFLPINTDEYLKLWSFANREGKMALIPFQRLRDNETFYLPECLLRSYYFTNGSCAGNTRQEALIQGMSEIAERFSAAQILTGRLTPPLLPKEPDFVRGREASEITKSASEPNRQVETEVLEESLAPYPFLQNAVRAIRESGRYTLRLMDASLGMGLPVMAIALMDRETGKVVLRFGAYPRLEIALERCLTEILQGRHLKRLETAPVFDYSRDAQATGIINRFNFVKAAFGDVPVEFFGSNPSWEYLLFQEAPESLEGQLRYMKELYARLGWEIYVRDCSFLGFPTYQLVVPGVSMVMDFGAERLGERRRMHVLRQNLSRLSLLSAPLESINAAEDMQDTKTQGVPQKQEGTLISAQTQTQILEEIKQLALIKQSFILENTFAFLSGVPITPTLLGVAVDARILAALCQISSGEYAQAAALLTPYTFDANGKMTGLYPLVELLKSNDASNVYELMQQLCPKGFAQRAREVLKNPLGALPSLPCPNCGSCPARDQCKADQLRNASQAIKEKEGFYEASHQEALETIGNKD